MLELPPSAARLGIAKAVTVSTGNEVTSIASARVRNPLLRARMAPPMAAPIAEPMVLPTYCSEEAEPRRSGGARVTRYLPWPLSYNYA